MRSTCAVPSEARFWQAIAHPPEKCQVAPSRTSDMALSDAVALDTKGGALGDNIVQGEPVVLGDDTKSPRVRV